MITVGADQVIPLPDGLAEHVISHVLDLEDAAAAFTTQVSDPTSSKVVLRTS